LYKNINMKISMDRRSLFGAGAAALLTGFLPRIGNAQEKANPHETIKKIASEMGIAKDERYLYNLLNKPESQKPLIINVRHDGDFDPNNENSINFPASNNVINLINDVDPTVNISKMLGKADVGFDTTIEFKNNTQGAQNQEIEELKTRILKRLNLQQAKRPIIVVCEAGVRSAYAAVILKKYYFNSPEFKDLEIYTFDDGLSSIKNPLLKSALTKQPKLSQLSQ
jgi:rhodanese-related sulfurtransferase